MTIPILVRSILGSVASWLSPCKSFSISRVATDSSEPRTTSVMERHSAQRPAPLARGSGRSILRRSCVGLFQGPLQRPGRKAYPGLVVREYTKSPAGGFFGTSQRRSSVLFRVTSAPCISPAIGPLVQEQPQLKRAVQETIRPIAAAAFEWPRRGPGLGTPGNF